MSLQSQKPAFALACTMTLVWLSTFSSAQNTSTTPPPSPPQPPVDAAQIQSVPAQTLEERVKNLRREVARMVKAPGAPLKSAPSSE